MFLHSIMRFLRRNGWYKSSLIEANLHWLRTQLTAAQLVLIFDQFDAHENLDVYRSADTPAVHLIFIHRGGKNQHQPLDRRTAMDRVNRTSFYAEKLWIQSSSPFLQ
jgi:tRNA G18 (ribose-2'-O)-methylase SpoU